MRGHGISAHSRARAARARGAPGWTPRTGWAAVAVGFGITVVSRSIIRDGGDPRFAVALALIALNLATVAVVIVFAGRHGRPRAAEFGLRRPPLARATALVIAVLVATLVSGAVWAIVLGIDKSAPSVTDRLAATSGTLNALLVLVLVAVASPLAEEFLFRGFFFRALRNWRGFWPAAVTSSVGLRRIPYRMGAARSRRSRWSVRLRVLPCSTAGRARCTRRWPCTPSSTRSASHRRWGGRGSFRWRSGSRSPRPS